MIRFIPFFVLAAVALAANSLLGTGNTVSGNSPAPDNNLLAGRNLTLAGQGGENVLLGYGHTVFSGGSGYNSARGWGHTFGSPELPVQGASADGFHNYVSANNAHAFGGGCMADTFGWFYYASHGNKNHGGAYGTMVYGPALYDGAAMPLLVSPTYQEKLALRQWHFYRLDATVTLATASSGWAVWRKGWSVFQPAAGALPQIQDAADLGSHAPAGWAVALQLEPGKAWLEINAPSASGKTLTASADCHLSFCQVTAN